MMNDDVMVITLFGCDAIIAIESLLVHIYIFKLVSATARKWMAAQQHQ